MTQSPSTPSAIRLQATVVSEAQGVIDGRADLLEVARSLRGYLTELGLDWEDPDYHVVAVIESETDDLPIGAERANWAPASLVRKEPEIQKARAWAEEIGGVEACRSLVARFSPAARRTNSGEVLES